MKLGALRFLALCGLTAGWCGVARSATLTWINPAGGDWNSTNNWSPGQVPASGDNVVITQNGTYTVTNTGSATLGSLTLGAASGIQTLNVASLTLTNSSLVNSNGVLNWSGGDLESSLTVGQGGTLTISNTVYFAYNNFSYGYTNTATLTNFGTAIWAATINAEPNSHGGGGGLIYNAGLWESVADNTLSPSYQYSGTNSYFINTGTLEKIGGTGISTIGWKFESNGGTLETPVGSFAFSQDWPGSSLVYGDATVSGNIGGIIASNAVLNWSGGDLEGALTVAQGGTLSISNTVYFAYNNYSYGYTNTATLTNYGTVIWAATIYAEPNSQGGGGGLIDNVGLWESVVDTILSPSYQYSGTNSYFINTGTLEKIGGTGTSTINWNFDNEGGTVTTLSGAFSMGNWTGNGLLVGNATYSSGTISGTLAPGAVINSSGATINGSLIVSSNAVLNWKSGDLGGALTVAPGGLLNWSGGDLEGTLTVAQGGTMTISNGITFSVNNPDYNDTNTATLTNYGTVLWAATITGYANPSGRGGGAIIDNAGLWESVADNTMNFNYGGTNLFLNTGTLEKIGGTGTSTINWNFDNEGGTVTTLAGAFSMGNWTGNGLLVGNATYSGGTISGTLAPGAAINSSSATINGSLIVSSNAAFNWKGGDLEGALTVAQGGTLTISNSITFSLNNPNYNYTNTATLTNYGTVLWAATITGYANPSGRGGGAIIDNAGLWESVADNTMNFNYGGTNLFLNTGTLEKIGGTGTSTINWGFNSTAVIQTFLGNFNLNWTGANTLNGNLTFNGTIAAPLIVASNAVLNLSGGDLEGALTVAQGGTMTISNSVTFSVNNPNYNYTNTATLTNYGTVVWATTITGYANPSGRGGGAIIDNAGLWESVADNTMNFNYGGTNLFLNTGTLEKIGGTGTSTFNWNVINNGGTVLALDGTIGFAAGLNLTNGLLDFAIGGPSSFGKITVSATANLAGGIGAVLLNGYVPLVGAQFNVMSFAANSNAFTDYSRLNAGGGIAFNPTVTATTLTLQAAATNFFGVAPFIVTQPSGETLNFNSTATLNVVVSGSPTLQFQWKQNGVPVPAGTNATLTLTNVLVSQAGAYTVAITNSAGGVVSQPAQLNVIPAVSVLTWSAPAGISYGTALSSNQLNASANTPGTYVYTPPAGTVLSAGGSTLSVAFTPTDSVDYTGAAASTSISVSQIPLRVAANNAGRTYGQTNPVFSGTITGLTNGDNITATYSCGAVPISPPGSYPIVPALVDPNGRQGNYSITVSNGSLTVSARAAADLHRHQSELGPDQRRDGGDAHWQRI